VSTASTQSWNLLGTGKRFDEYSPYRVDTESREAGTRGTRLGDDVGRRGSCAQSSVR